MGFFSSKDDRTKEEKAVDAQEAAPVRPVTVPGRVLRPAIASAGGRRHLSGMLPEAVLQRLGAPGGER